MRRHCVFVAVTAALLFAVAPATAGSDLGKKFGRSPTPINGVQTTEGSVLKPRGITLRLTTNPGFEFQVTYSMDCSRRLRKPRQSRQRDGAFIVDGPGTFGLKQTWRHAAKCFAVATAFPKNNPGPAQLQLFARHPPH